MTKELNGPAVLSHARQENFKAHFHTMFKWDRVNKNNHPLFQARVSILDEPQTQHMVNQRSGLSEKPSPPRACGQGRPTKITRHKPSVLVPE